LESGANDSEKSQSTLNEFHLRGGVSRFSSGAESECTAEHQPDRGRVLRHGRLLQRRSHVLLQEENEARQERSRLLQRQEGTGVLLLQGRFVSDA